MASSITAYLALRIDNFTTTVYHAAVTTRCSQAKSHQTKINTRALAFPSYKKLPVELQYRIWVKGAINWAGDHTFYIIFLPERYIAGNDESKLERSYKTCSLVRTCNLSRLVIFELIRDLKSGGEFGQFAARVVPRRAGCGVIQGAGSWLKTSLCGGRR